MGDDLRMWDYHLASLSAAGPTLLIHGDADVSARLELAARRTQAMLTGSTLTITKVRRTGWWRPMQNDCIATLSP